MHFHFGDGQEVLGFTLFTLILVRHIKRNKLGLKKADREKMHDDFISICTVQRLYLY